MRAGRGKKRRENVVNTKCLQASRQAGGWRLLSEAICYAPAIISSFHLSPYISIYPFSSTPLSPSSCVAQHGVGTSAIHSMCAWQRSHVWMHVCIVVCVGVGDKAVLQHHCVNKAPVCCLLLLITAQHNVSAQLVMHKIWCVRVLVCACMRKREREREALKDFEWIKMRKMKSGISSWSRFVFLSLP